MLSLRFLTVWRCLLSVALPLMMFATAASAATTTATRIRPTIPAATPKIQAQQPAPKATAPRTTPATKPKPVVRRAQRRAPARRPVPALLAQPQQVPQISAVPRAVIALLEDGDLASAARRLYMAPGSTRNLMLIREMERIGESRVGIKPSPDERHRHFLNLGIAYHNLFLLLRTHADTPKLSKVQRRFLQKARDGYRRARKTAAPDHRAEIEVLLASLDAASGKQDRAKKYFVKKVDAKALGQSFRGATYLATYYAALGDAERTVAALQTARQYDRDATLRDWMAIADDFQPVRDTPAFQTLLQELMKPRRSR